MFSSFGSSILSLLAWAKDVGAIGTTLIGLFGFTCIALFTSVVLSIRKASKEPAGRVVETSRNVSGARRAIETLEQSLADVCDHDAKDKWCRRALLVCRERFNNVSTWESLRKHCTLEETELSEWVDDAQVILGALNDRITTEHVRWSDSNTTVVADANKCRKVSARLRQFAERGTKEQLNARSNGSWAKGWKGDVLRYLQGKVSTKNYQEFCGVADEGRAAACNAGTDESRQQFYGPCVKWLSDKADSLVPEDLDEVYRLDA